jgi:protein-tyrosine-phosphatase
MVQGVDFVAGMSCRVQGICAGPFSKPTIDWELEDPKGKSIEKVREIRDEIELGVNSLITEKL